MVDAATDQAKNGWRHVQTVTKGMHERKVHSQPPTNVPAAVRSGGTDATGFSCRTTPPRLSTPALQRLMARLCDGFLVLPGGLGTLEELAEMTTWSQLGIRKRLRLA